VLSPEGCARAPSHAAADSGRQASAGAVSGSASRIASSPTPRRVVRPKAIGDGSPVNSSNQANTPSEYRSEAVQTGLAGDSARGRAYSGVSAPPAIWTSVILVRVINLAMAEIEQHGLALRGVTNHVWRAFRSLL